MKRESMTSSRTTTGRPNHQVGPQLVDLTCDLDLGIPGQGTVPDLQAGPGLSEAGLISDQTASVSLTAPWLRPEGEPGEY